jgi:hypothetical protein
MTEHKSNLERWLSNAKKNKDITHIVVVCDTFSYEDYPVYVKKGEDVREICSKYDGKEMQTVMEVYSLREDIEKQLNSHRAFNFD